MESVPVGDFAVFDNFELITYQQGNAAPLENVRAVRRPLTQSQQRNVERYIQLEPGDVVWHVDIAGFHDNGTYPAPGDLVTTADQQEFNVIFAEEHAFNTIVAVIGRLV